MNVADLNVEMLIEFRGLKKEADGLAGMIKINGAQVSVGNANGRRNDHHSDAPRDLSIWVMEHVDTYRAGENRIRAVKGILRQFESQDSEIVMGKSGVYDKNGNEIYKNGHSE